MLFDRNREFCYHRFLGQRSEDHIIILCTACGSQNQNGRRITFMCVRTENNIIIPFVVLIGEYQTIDSSNVVFYLFIFYKNYVDISRFQSLTTARRPRINVITREVIAIILYIIIYYVGR